MRAHKLRLWALCIATGVSGVANAALQGRDLDGNTATFEAYYDTVLDITWLGDANYAKTSDYAVHGLMSWDAATAWAAQLSFYNPLTKQIIDDWRLPAVDPVNGVSFNYNFSYNGSTDVGDNITSVQSEMAYMFYVNLGNLGYYTPSGTSSGCYLSSVNTCLDNVGPFVNLQPSLYWSATEYVEYTQPIGAMAFWMSYGTQSIGVKSSHYYAWAVRSGDVAAVPEAQTYALMLAGLGLIAMRVRMRE